jgi:O-antigen/teichoic acid export membrane protein
MGAYFMPMNALSMTAGRTAAIPLITLVAASANVGLNLLLVPRFGAIAAAVNTAIGYGILAALTFVYAQRVVPLKYEIARVVKVALAALALYIAGSYLPVHDYAWHILLSLVLVSSMPLILWLMGFWTPVEKEVVARTLKSFGTSLRTNRQGY